MEWPSPAYGGRYGATHVTDVPLVFHNIHDQEILGNGSDAKVMADQLAAAWVAFARTGNPSHPGIPYWPPYTTAKRETMIFNLKSRVEDDSGRVDRPS